MSEEEEVMSKVDEDLEVESEDSEEEVITIWAAEKNASDDVLTIPIDEWIDEGKIIIEEGNYKGLNWKKRYNRY